MWSQFTDSQSHSEKIKSVQTQPKEHQQRGLTSASKRRPQSAAVGMQRRQIRQQEENTEEKEKTAEIYLRVSSFMNKINDHRKVLPDGVFNYPSHEQFYNPNKFRPASSKRSGRLRKIAYQSQQASHNLDFFINTLTSEFKIFKPDVSSIILSEHTQYSKPTRSDSLRRRTQTFESLSAVKYKQASRNSVELSIQGKKCF